MDKILIQVQDFDLGLEVKLVQKLDNKMGAIVSFVGIVRDLLDTNLLKLHLEHYPQMTEKSLKNIITKVRKKWDLGAVTIIHRVGDLGVNENIVLVIVSSPHRGDSFAACEFIMDYLKTNAPFWKKEITSQGENWVQSRESDIEKLKQYKTL